MGVRKKISKTVQKRAQKTVMKLMQDERTRPAMAKAMQAYMDGKQRVDEIRDQTAHSLGLVTESDVQKLKGRLRRLERSLNSLQRQFGSLERVLES